MLYIYIVISTPAFTVFSIPCCGTAVLERGERLHKAQMRVHACMCVCVRACRCTTTTTSRMVTSSSILCSPSRISTPHQRPHVMYVWMHVCTLHCINIAFRSFLFPCLADAEDDALSCLAPYYVVNPPWCPKGRAPCHDIPMSCRVVSCLSILYSQSPTIATTCSRSTYLPYIRTYVRIEESYSCHFCCLAFASCAAAAAPYFGTKACSAA